jgi:folylpolyglutamate synthase/dihydropteroate synthase
MIDAYVYAELRNMLKTADADAFGGYAYTSLISDKDFTLFSQALYPLLNEYFAAKAPAPSNTSNEALKELIEELELVKLDLIKTGNDAIFYKSIIKKLLENK